MAERYYRLGVAVGVLSGTTAPVPLRYRPNTVGDLLDRKLARNPARYYRLIQFFRLSSLSGTTGLVPVQVPLKYRIVDGVKRYLTGTKGGSTASQKKIGNIGPNG